MPLSESTRPPAAAFIFLTVFLDMLALGIIVPVLPRLVESFLHNNVSAAARVMGLFAASFAVMQFFCSPIAGALSDHYGRRPIVLLSNFGLGLDYLVIAWAPALPWLFLGRILAGLTSSSIPTALAYVADVTPTAQRAATFGLFNAAFAAGFVLGPALGGALGSLNPRLPFLVAAGLSLLNALYGFFVLPESLAPANRSPFSWKRANPIGAVALLLQSRTLIALSALLLLTSIAACSFPQVYVLYAGYRFHWTNRTIGISIGLMSLCTILYGTFLVKPLLRTLGQRRGILFGLLFAAAGYLGYGLSKTGLLVWCAIPFVNLLTLVSPFAQAIITASTAANRQGQLQGAINTLRGAAGILGPYLFAILFANAVGNQPVISAPGLPFLASAACLLLAIPITLYATRSR